MPPSGQEVFQGFATISGGGAGAFRILRPRVVRDRDIVDASGLDLGPGRITLRVQSLPSDG